MPFTVVGTPGDRRVDLLTAACRACDLPPPQVVAWRDVLSGHDLALTPGTMLRIDSPGEDPACDALLRGAGDPSRVCGTARWYATFTAALQRLAAAAASVGAVVLNDPAEIGVMFDKRLCHGRLRAAGVSVPPALDGPVGGYAELRERMAEAGWARVFIKPAHGSSASGVVALQTSGRRVKAVTSAVPGPGGLYNSLRVRPYESDDEVAVLIDTLAGDGVHVEQWVPKAAINGRAFDLRVVVIGGVPTHAVVRTSRSPMTNLHLGGSRGDLDAVRKALGEDGWGRALDMCAQAASCFPGSLMAGVDLLVAVGWRRMAVGEVNAFGDLLPGLTGLPGSGAEGLDTYTAQVKAALCAT